MVIIEILQAIKHEGQQYHAGELRKIDSMTAGYFCGNGWAKHPRENPIDDDTSPKTLTVQKGQIGHSATTA